MIVWAVVIREVIKFIVALIAGGAITVVASSYNTDVVQKVSASDGMFTGFVWAAIGGVAVYLWMSGWTVTSLLTWVLRLVKMGINSVVTAYRNA